MSHFVYMVKCADDTLYTGYTTDVERRVEEHNGGPKGAKYTKVRQPVSLVYTEECVSRSDATRREAQIKKMTRIEKLTLIT